MTAENKARQSSTSDRSPEDIPAEKLALLLLDAARMSLHCYAFQTDAPALGTVEAADFIDAARDALAQGIGA